MKEMLSVSNVAKIYGSGEGTTRALAGVNLSVKEGEFVAIMGPSGSGKTTLLNCIATIDKQTSGAIVIDGVDLSEVNKSDLAAFRRGKLGFIFQDYNLIDSMTIYDNIAIALTINNVAKAEIDERIKAISEKLGIVDKLQKYPYEVSGGQKQRCAAARAIINNPKLVLADEPTGALDSASSAELMRLLQVNLNKELGATIVMVTHDAKAASYAGKVVFLKDGRVDKIREKENMSDADFYAEIMGEMA